MIASQWLRKQCGNTINSVRPRVFQKSVYNKRLGRRGRGRGRGRRSEEEVEEAEGNEAEGGREGGGLGGCGFAGGVTGR